MVGEWSTFKFRLQVWDGRYAHSPPLSPNQKLNSVCRSSIPILTSDRCLIALMAGQPEDDNWHTLNDKGSATLEQAWRECRIPPKKLLHCRSQFSALRCGFSHGGGQKFPSNWRNTAKNAKVPKILNSCRPFKRFAGFSPCMAHYLSF